MEKLNITTTKDNEKVYKILGDLMNANKEFQIMITVPSTKNAKDSTVKATEKKEQTQEVIHDLEKDVTNWISLRFRIGSPRHISIRVISICGKPIMIVGGVFFFIRRWAPL